jgi:hypothetical protein
MTANLKNQDQSVAKIISKIRHLGLSVRTPMNFGECGNKLRVKLSGLTAESTLKSKPSDRNNQYLFNLVLSCGIDRSLREHITRPIEEFMKDKIRNLIFFATGLICLQSDSPDWFVALICNTIIEACARS